MTDAPQTAPPRSKVELLYQEILRESYQLLGRLEQIALQQADIQQALAALPGTIRQAGQEAATQAADHASRAMLDATRALAHATSELRIASLSAQGALPVTVWRVGLLCAASSFLGTALSAAVLAFTL